MYYIQKFLYYYCSSSLNIELYSYYSILYSRFLGYLLSKFIHKNK